MAYKSRVQVAGPLVELLSNNIGKTFRTSELAAMFGSTTSAVSTTFHRLHQSDWAIVSPKRGAYKCLGVGSFDLIKSDDIRTGVKIPKKLIKRMTPEEALFVPVAVASVTVPEPVVVVVPLPVSNWRVGDIYVISYVTEKGVYMESVDGHPYHVVMTPL